MSIEKGKDTTVMKEGSGIKVGEGYVVRLPRKVVKKLKIKEQDDISVTTIGDRYIFIKRTDSTEIEPAFMGSITRFPLADIFSMITMTQKTGALVITSSNISKTIFFQNGDIVFASSTDEEEKIGKILYKLGFITMENLESAEKEISEGMRFGSILLKKNLISPKELWWAIKYQIEEIVYSVFNLKEGEFSFFENVLPDKDLIRMPVSTQNLLMEGFRRMDEWQVMKERIPNNSVVLELTENTPQVQMSEVVKCVIQAIDGKSDINEVIRKTKLGEFNTYKILYQLLKLGVIRIVGEKMEFEEREKKSTVDKWLNLINKYNEIYNTIFNVLKINNLEIKLLQSIDDFFGSVSERMKRLFLNIHIDGSGKIDGNTMIQNLKDAVIADSEKLIKIGGFTGIMSDQFLLEGLNELLNFELFMCKNLLSSEEAEKIIKQAKEMQMKG